MKYFTKGPGRTSPVLGHKSDRETAIHVPRATEGSSAGEDGHEVEDEGAGAAAASVVGAACIIGTSDTATAAETRPATTTAASPSPSSTAICCCCCATAAASMAAAKAAAVAITLFDVVGSEADEVAVAAAHAAPDKIRCRFDWRTFCDGNPSNNASYFRASACIN